MHLNPHDASILVHRLQERIPTHRDVEVVLAPSMLVLNPLSHQIDRRKFRLAAQDAYFEDEGAFTGEVSFNMLRELVHYGIIGHSERRYKFNESDKTTSLKVGAALRNEIEPILCIGETSQERLANETNQVIHDQLLSGLQQVGREDIKHLVITYEPVWAISDGSNYKRHKMPTPTDVKEVVDVIRHNISEVYGKAAEEKVRVLYGGSTNSENARAYLDVDGVDGLLVGGASLNYQQFADIVDAAFRYSKSYGRG